MFMNCRPLQLNILVPIGCIAIQKQVDAHFSIYFVLRFLLFSFNYEGRRVLLKMFSFSDNECPHWLITNYLPRKSRFSVVFLVENCRSAHETVKWVADFVPIKTLSQEEKNLFQKYLRISRIPTLHTFIKLRKVAKCLRGVNWSFFLPMVPLTVCSPASRLSQPNSQLQSRLTGLNKLVYGQPASQPAAHSIPKGAMKWKSR